MRKTNCLFGILLATGVLSVGALQTQAAELSYARAGACKAGEGQQRAGACAAAKRVRATQAVVVPPTQMTKTTLDRSVCSRLQGQVERDTCLNHVEANA
ncbi:MAG: hypothetical protein JWN73_3827 [Betaproteobacteria bacterium]|nr:hypothetical protein [Betaproteobacteria bacterium]